MGRPSKKEERTEEILNAFYRCVSRFGLEGSSLERIAEEAGLKRSLVRHFVGNRDELTLLLVDRVLKQSDEQWQVFVEYLPATNTSKALLDGLFSGEGSDPEFVLVLESLIFASSRHESMRERMQRWMNNFTNDVAAILQAEFPEAPQKKLNAAAYGIISIYFNLDSLAPLELNDLYRPAARDAAEFLLLPLKDTSPCK